MNINSKCVAQGEPISFDTTDQHKTTEEELWKPKGETQNAIPKDLPVITVSRYYANDLKKTQQL